MFSAPQPPTPQPAAARHLPPEEFDRWYGPWDPLNPRTIAAFMDGFDRPWWVIGGWSIEAFTGVARQHEDMDISILSCDAEAFRLFLGDRYTPWNVDEGWFRPFDARFADVRPDSQVWVRRDARSPWLLDVPFTPATDGRWTNKRHPAHTEDLDAVTWIAPDGLRYARPEVTLMFKAAQARDKDRRDAEAALPKLDAQARRWLRDTVACLDPRHDWVHACSDPVCRSERCTACGHASGKRWVGGGHLSWSLTSLVTASVIVRCCVLESRGCTTTRST